MITIIQAFLNNEVLLHWLLANSPQLFFCGVGAWLAWSLRGVAGAHTGRVEKVEIKNSDLSAQIARVDDRVTKLEENIDQRFEKVDQRFEKVDQRFEKMEAQFEARFEKMEAQFEKMEARFEKLEDRFEKMEDKISSIDKHVAALPYSIELTIERSKNEIVSQLIGFLDGHPWPSPSNHEKKSRE